MCIQDNGKSKPNGMLFSGEPLETGSIHNSGYWKIAGLTACYFQGNSWKLGASIIRVIGKQQAQRPAIFRGTLGNWGLPQFGLLENSRPSSLLFSGELLETGGIHKCQLFSFELLDFCISKQSIVEKDYGKVNKEKTK